MTRILARVVDREGRLLQRPNASFQLIEDGKPVLNYFLDQIEDLALKQIAVERDPQPMKYDPEEATHGNQR